MFQLVANLVLQRVKCVLAVRDQIGDGFGGLVSNRVLEQRLHDLEVVDLTGHRSDKGLVQD